MALEFCEKCCSVMILKEKNGTRGIFVCRNCNCAKNAPASNIQITEKVDHTPEVNLERLVAVRRVGMF